MENNNKNSAGGFGLDIILTLIFVVLKLCGVIDWAWVWVLAPLWIGAALMIILIIILIIITRIKQKRFWD